MRRSPALQVRIEVTRVLSSCQAAASARHSSQRSIGTSLEKGARLVEANGTTVWAADSCHRRNEWDSRLLI